MDLAHLLGEVKDYQTFGSLEIFIQGIASDSREVKEGYLFVAYKGLKEDGHKFIPRAIEGGAVAVIGEENPEALKIPSSVTYIQVRDSREVLALISSAWFDYPSKKLKIIGVTGTDGKTTTSTLIYELLKQAGKKVGLISTVAAYIGDKVYDTGFHVTSPDPYSMQKFLAKMVERDCKYAVIEVTSHAIDQKRIGGIKFWIAVLTNITPEHLDYHKTFLHYRETKAKLFKNIDLAVLNFDDSSFDFIKRTSDAKKIISYSLNDHKADFFTSDIKIKQNQTIFCLGNEKEEPCLETTLLGNFNVANTLAAVSVARFMGISLKSLRETLKTFHLPEGRLEEVNKGQNFNVVIDFAHTPNALESVLRFLRSMSKGKLIAVFGSAGERDEEKRPLMGLAASKYADLIVLTEEDPRTEDVNKIINQIEKGVRRGVEVVRMANREEAINYAIGIAKKDDCVGIFGKGHEKTINRDGIKEILWSDRKVAEKAIGDLLNKMSSLDVNFKHYNHIHLTGIKGVAMTSLALCLQDMGIKLTGSDTDELFVTDEILSRRKIGWINGFSKNNIADKVDLVITTGAHGGLNNPECLYAKSKGIPVVTHAQALGMLAENKETVAVCGVGGKTTTSSMIANMLSNTGQRPSFAIGVGEIFPLGVAGKYDETGKCFVCEADEFAVSPGVDNRPRFTFLNPRVLVVTNIEHDHPDIYPDLGAVKKAYVKFFNNLKSDSLLVANIDNVNVQDLLEGYSKPLKTYGFGEKADFRILNNQIIDHKQHFILKEKNGTEYAIALSVFGDFNILNAAAAFIVGQYYQIETAKLIAGLENFKGSKRRFEKIGVTQNGALVYDDYAHHPKEIMAIIKMAKELYPDRRLITVFQPHTYSRTKALFNDFAQSFNESDKAIFMDIYSSAREAKNPEVSSEILAEKVKKYQKEAYYTKNHRETLAWLNQNTQEGDVVLTLGAGDIFYLHKNLVFKNEKL